MGKSPIAFFDSGVGQFSVLLETKKLLPGENFIIFADQINNPYGEKSKAEIQSFTEKAVRFLISKNHIKMMVLACNTATVLALDYLRKKFNIPIIGVVPAVKPAYILSKKKKIAVMSTLATAKSTYLSNLIKMHGNGAKTLKIGCEGLEEAIEILDYKTIDKLVKIYSKKVKLFGADVVVLGCTHYPLVKNKIQKELGLGIKVIDSGQAVARQIKSILKKTNLVSGRKKDDIFYTTGDSRNFSKVASILLKSKINAKMVSI